MFCLVAIKNFVHTGRMHPNASFYEKKIIGLTSQFFAKIIYVQNLPFWLFQPLKFHRTAMMSDLMFSLFITLIK